MDSSLENQISKSFYSILRVPDRADNSMFQYSHNRVAVTREIHCKKMLRLPAVYIFHIGMYFSACNGKNTVHYITYIKASFTYKCEHHDEQMPIYCNNRVQPKRKKEKEAKERLAMEYSTGHRRNFINITSLEES